MKMTKATETETDSDGLARERALDVTASFAVQAPAGSGKTELLMQRFLALLAMAGRPEQILALTFTRKAAGEMHSRIIGAMRKAAEGYEPEKPHEKKTIGLAASALERDSEMGWGLLENPGRLRVRTIDSFSSALSAQMPLLSGLGRCSVTEEPAEFYGRAAEATIALVEDDGPEGEAVRGALAHLDNSVRGLSDRLVMMLGKRDQWLRHVRTGATDGELKSLVEGSVRRLVEFELKNAKEAFPERAIDALVRCARHAAANIGNNGGAIPALASIGGLPSGRAEDLPLWKGIRELLLTAKDEWRKPGGVNSKLGFHKGDAAALSVKEDFQGLLSYLEGEGGALLEPLSRVRLLPRPEFEREEWEALLALMRLLPIAEGKLMRAFTEAGAVDFQAVGLAALKALGTDGEPTDLMLALDLKIQHILVDEYQDTSQTQLALLEALTRGWTRGDGRTLFVVGDPMQSIYLFREAEVGLFLEARLGGIGGVPLTPLTLSRNFRSEGGIVAWVNETLGRAFPGREDTFTGSVTYARSTPVKEAAGGRGVGIDLFMGRDDGLEAGRVMDIVKAIPADETAAILCRSRTHVAAIVDSLKREGRPFRADGLDPLSERPVVQDLFALLKALDHPFDRVAWLAVLRAPWCGLGLADLLKLCSGDKGSALIELMRDGKRAGTLSEDGKKRLQRLRENIETALGDWGRRPPSEAVRGLWISMGGPACAGDGPGMLDAEEFLRLVESVQGPGGISIKALEAGMKRLYAGGGGEGAALEVMTIHKAKGLEFDNVIIPGLGRAPKREDKRVLVWMERGEEDLLLAPVERKGTDGGGSIYNYLFSIHKEKLDLEETRLFYVAATRARKSLFLMGHVEAGGNGGGSPGKRSFLSRIKDALGNGMIFDGRPLQREAAMGPARKRLGLSWELPEAAPPVPADSNGRPVEAGAGEPEFYWAGEAIRHLGTVVHRYLCRIAAEGMPSWGTDRVRAEEPRMAAMLRGAGLGKKEASSAAKEGVRIIIKAMEDGKGRWILSGHPEAATELPVTAVLAGGIVHLVIDRTFVDAEGVRWVIDYKTGAHEGGSLDEFLSNERARYGAQLERYAEALRAGGETREIRKGLYYPAHSAWVEVK